MDRCRPRDSFNKKGANAPKKGNAPRPVDFEKRKNFPKTKESVRWTDADRGNLKNEQAPPKKRECPSTG